MQPCLIPIISH